MVESEIVKVGVLAGIKFYYLFIYFEEQQSLY